MKRRFMAAFIALGLLVLLVQDIPLASYLRGVETERIMTTLERDAFVLAGRSERALRTADSADDASTIALAQRYRSSGGARVVIVDASGRAVVSSDDDEASTIGSAYGSRPEIAQALTGKVATGSRYSQTLQLQLLYVTVPVLSGDEVLGAVRLTYPEQVVTDAVTAQLRQLGIVALTTVLLAGIVAYILTLSVTRRLDALRSVTESFAEGDLSVRADESTGAPEIRSLSVSFNQMATRLDYLVTQQRTFASDASHQLRTPLTALRLRLERALDLLPTDPSAAQERLVAADSEAERLGTLIDGLLLLSRMGAVEVERVVVDLAGVAADRVKHWQPLADELDLTLTLDSPPAPPSTPVLAAAGAVEQIIDNYVDNAMSASGPGAAIALAVESWGDHVSLRVADEGAGLTAEDCGRAFERFWRADTESAGTGLGLAIVAKLAEASGASVSLAPGAERGVIASAVFEAASPPGE